LLDFRTDCLPPVNDPKVGTGPARAAAFKTCSIQDLQHCCGLANGLSEFTGIIGFVEMRHL
jgi:hypothetical protein